MKTLLILFSLLSYFQLFCQDTSNVEKEIFNKINNYRVNLGKGKLTYNTTMVKSCRSHSKFMGTNNNLVHVKSLSEVGANAEIIQLNYTDGRTNSEIGIDVLDIFVDSPSHKKIIEGGYKQISVGVYITSDKDLWVTIRFI
jgi:uncharacterized protein YkwD